MSKGNALGKFLGNLHADVAVRSEIEGGETLRAHVFTQMMIDDLIEAGELQDGQPCYHRARAVEVSGYGLGDEDTLDLFATMYREVTPPVTITRTEVETAFKRLAAFLKRAMEGYHQVLEEASPVFDMALTIYEARQRLRRVRFFLFTDGVARVEFKSDGQLGKLPVSFHIWDIVRLQRYMTSGQTHEPIRIDFEQEFQAPVPCLPAPANGADYAAYMAIIPGKVLAGIYEKYGPRLLELNVRSFLQARGKVNQGIRKTIIEEPHRFLAYNNGISATAHEVEIVSIPGGGQGIRAITGLQIVNGGQTTASLHHAAKRDRADLSAVSVQAKVTVVDGEKLNAIVPLISRYANSQNTVNEADFSANDPFHVRLEELSRGMWAPATGGTQRQTRWFYERARGQYQDALAREGTPSKMRQFKLQHPTTQKFTKTDLAKYENTWEGFPYLVSFGAQKNFREFTLRLKEEATSRPKEEGIPELTERYFQHLIAKAILFRRAEKVVSQQQFGGYRANIVTYTLAWLVNRTGGRIDLDRIWAAQDITPALSEVIATVSHEVHGSVTNPPRGGNVTEWCKRKACWERVSALEIELADDFVSELLPGNVAVGRGGRVVEELSQPEQALVQAVSRIGAEVWYEVSGWAKETNSLQGWQRGLAFSLGQLAVRGRNPSVKQAKQGLKLLEQATKLGYQVAQPLVASHD